MKNIITFEISEMINKLNFFEKREEDDAIKLRYLMTKNILSGVLKDLTTKNSE